MSNLPKLFAKLAKASAAIATVEKTGRNTEQKYDYVTDADVAYAVRRACHVAGVFVGMLSAERLSPPDEIVSKHGTKGVREYIRVVVQFVDVETGEGHSVSAIATGMDYGDKAMAKAITSAVKYCLLKGLCLPTGDDPEGDDPEGDEQTDREPAAAARPAPQSATVRPDHHALGKFMAENRIPREMFARICGTNLKLGHDTKITDLSQTQVATVTRLLQQELEPGDLESAVEDGVES